MGYRAKEAAVSGLRNCVHNIRIPYSVVGSLPTNKRRKLKRKVTSAPNAETAERLIRNARKH